MIVDACAYVVVEKREIGAPMCEIGIVLLKITYGEMKPETSRRHDASELVETEPSSISPAMYFVQNFLKGIWKQWRPPRP